MTEFPPVRLLPESAKTLNLTGMFAVASGYGKTERGYYSEDLLKTTLQILPESSCQNTPGSSFQFKADHKIFCAASASQSGTCDADSGGPLTMMYEGQQYLLGITSFGYAPLSCEYAQRSSFTKVLPYHEWIWDVIKKNSN